MVYEEMIFFIKGSVEKVLEMLAEDSQALPATWGLVLLLFSPGFRGARQVVWRGPWSRQSRGCLVSDPGPASRDEPGTIPPLSWAHWVTSG